VRRFLAEAFDAFGDQHSSAHFRESGNPEALANAAA
jgi:hypothetical protein